MDCRLKEIMAKKQITQKMLAEKLAISVSTFNFKINGKSEFTLAEAMQIARILNTNIDAIFKIKN